MNYDPQFEQWQDTLSHLYMLAFGTSIYDANIDLQNLYDRELTPQEALTHCMGHAMNMTCTTCGG